MTSVRTERPFLPAAGHDWLLPLYDPLTGLLGAGSARRRLLEQATVRASQRVLDVGCGTGSLAVLIKQRYPAVEVVAVDPDPKALARAERKARRAGVAIRFDRGFGDALGYTDARFDRVFSSMMFHHLDAQGQAGMLREIRRVLKPGGRLHLLDFAGPLDDSRGLTRLFHSHHRLKGNADWRIRGLMADAGLMEPQKVAEHGSLFGRIAYYRAIAPATAWS
jgi:ubiquinone/menaquinone biosynthesis C-methylase UbiE